MSFVSVTFLIFLPIVFGAYWMLWRHHRAQNMLLLVASYVFYGWWDWRFLSLIFVTSMSSYVSGLLLERCQHRRWIVAGNIVLNLGILAVFKYYDFFIDNLRLLFPQLDAPTLSLILPVGISFYTFQSLSYTIDIYRRHLNPTREVVAFFAYIAFFPQLVAGPIERATHLLPQMLGERRFRYEEAVDGLRRILWGFFKKMVIADNCAIAVNLIWGDFANAGTLTLVTGMLLFTFQIYGDFSGYSDIAIGTARLFGIRLMENFRLPYFASSMPEFWRRWHISLMTWFRDYLYIPLGGSRDGTPRWIRNTILVFLLSGLWHGANWTFVVWGLYNACLLILWRYVRIRSIMLTFLLAAIGWVIFRSADIAEASAYLQRMTVGLLSFDFGTVAHGKRTLLWCLLLVVVEWVQRQRTHPLQVDGLPAYVRWTLYYLLFFVTFFVRGEEQTFIYFQF
jgi:D-alanyl-lipoteichoic acid acyltransferase DltB (MBOAT superfamily)